jgi:hypothetical protein
MFHIKVQILTTYTIRHVPFFLFDEPFLFFRKLVKSDLSFVKEVGIVLERLIIERPISVECVSFGFIVTGLYLNCCVRRQAAWR